MAFSPSTTWAEKSATRTKKFQQRFSKSPGSLESKGSSQFSKIFNSPLEKKGRFTRAVNTYQMVLLGQSPATVAPESVETPATILGQATETPVTYRKKTARRSTRTIYAGATGGSANTYQTVLLGQ